MCHQTVSLVARHLESIDIPTVTLGCARDIVEECGVPRFLFVDFPLGNPCGKPFDRDMQYNIAGGALELLSRGNILQEEFPKLCFANVARAARPPRAPQIKC